MVQRTLSLPSDNACIKTYRPAELAFPAGQTVGRTRLPNSLGHALHWYVQIQVSLPLYHRGVTAAILALGYTSYLAYEAYENSYTTEDL